MSDDKIIQSPTSGFQKEFLSIRADLDKMAQIITMQSQTIQIMNFAIEYLLEKLEVDKEEFQKYIDNKMKEYIETVKEELKKSNIVIPR
jgi:hypothetical protein